MINRVATVLEAYRTQVPEFPPLRTGDSARTRFPDSEAIRILELYADEKLIQRELVSHSAGPYQVYWLHGEEEQLAAIERLDYGKGFPNLKDALEVAINFAQELGEEYFGGRIHVTNPKGDDLVKIPCPLPQKIFA